MFQPLIERLTENRHAESSVALLISAIAATIAAADNNPTLLRALVIALTEERSAIASATVFNTPGDTRTPLVREKVAEAELLATAQADSEADAEVPEQVTSDDLVV